MPEELTTADTAKPAPSWRDRVKVHPAANDYPMLSDAELDVLSKDIKERGLQHGLTFWTPANYSETGSRKRGESILDWADRKKFDLYQIDGRNRLAAIDRITNAETRDLFLGVAFNCDDRELAFARLLYGDIQREDSLPACVASLNLYRRHLSLEDRERRAAEVLKDRPELSNRQVAEQVKLSHPKVGKIRKRLEEAGEVETVTTIVGADGVEQPAHKATPKPSIEIDGKPASLDEWSAIARNIVAEATQEPAATPAPQPIEQNNPPRSVSETFREQRQAEADRTYP